MSWLGDLILALMRPRPKPRPGPVPPPVPTPPPTPPPASDIPGELLAAHNRERAAAGLAPLALEPRLQRAAQGHADHMAEVGKMAHQGIGDGDLSDRIAASGYRASRAGENVAWNQRDVPAVMFAWTNSPGHRANILGPYRDAGLAVAYGTKGDPYWCSLFGSPSARMTGAVTVVASPDSSTVFDPGPGFRAAFQSSASSTAIVFHPSAG